MTLTNRRTLLAAPLLAAALVATGGGVAQASTPICKGKRRPLRTPDLGASTLRRGSRGTHVKSLQNLINHMPRLKNSSGRWYSPACPLGRRRRVRKWHGGSSAGRSARRRADPGRRGGTRHPQGREQLLPLSQMKNPITARVMAMAGRVRKNLTITFIRAGVMTCGR